MLPPELANPFSEPRDLDPDTAKMVGDMLGKKAKEAFEALDEESPKPTAKGQMPTAEEIAAMRKAEERLMERRELIKPWKTIRIGECKTLQEIEAALRDRGFRISKYAGQILEKVILSVDPSEIDLVILTAEELGFEVEKSDFDSEITLEEIFDCARELGLDLCPAEVGPYLCLQYPDQPIDEWLTIAMEHIENSNGYPIVFRVGHDGEGRWLVANSGLPNERFVFLHRKK